LRECCWNQQQERYGQQQLALDVASAAVTILQIVKSEQMFSYPVSTSCAALLFFRTEMTIGIDLGDAWSHSCTLNEEGVVDRGRLRTTPKAVETWFTDLAPARVAMEAGTHSIWISEGYITEKQFPRAVLPWIADRWECS
jgi:hypothetical protein